MFRIGSLKIRIIVLTTIPITILFVFILLGTIQTANNAVRTTIETSLTDAGSVFMQLLTTRQDELRTMARVTVRDPRFFATFSIPESERGEEFAPTLDGVSLDFLRITEADFLQIFDAHGQLISHVNRDGTHRTSPAPVNVRTLEQALRNEAALDFYREDNNLVASVMVPVYVSRRIEALVRLGSYLDNDFVFEVQHLTGAEVTLCVGTDELASTFSSSSTQNSEWDPGDGTTKSVNPSSMTVSPTFTMPRADTDYLAIRVRVLGSSVTNRFDAYLARELQAELAPLLSFERKIAVAGIFAVLVTVLIGVALAASITKPLSSVVHAAAAIENGKYDFPLDVTGSDELASLNRSFEAMRKSFKTYVEHLKNIDQVKSNFIALAGHELRTPLTIITGFNEMIVSGALGEIPDKIKETTQHIQEQLMDLNALVQKILDLSMIEQGMLELYREDTDLRSIVTTVADKRAAAFEERNLTIINSLPTEPVLVSVDPGRIEQALLGLLDNAIRFTPDGGDVFMMLSIADGKARLKVKDTGIGIPTNEIEWIFDKLYEVGDVTKHSSGKYQFGSRGIGLGLAVTKALVEQHAGEIEVKSTPGHGSEFTVVLDMQTADRSEPALIS